MNNLLTEAKTAIKNSYAPYSNFHVGCAIKTDQENVFRGCNIENASYSLTLCAEASAIAAMINHGDKKITEITIISSGEDFCSPCGACRQRIREFAAPHTLVHMYNVKEQYKTMTLQELLPLSFGPEHLEKK